MGHKTTSQIAGLKLSTYTAVLKGSLAYVLFFILFFIDSFRGLLQFPTTGGSAILFCIAAFPGKSVGACMLSLLLGLGGIALGTLNFFVLAHLAAYPAVPAIVFFLMVYFLCRIKAFSPHLLAFSLLCILMSWNGIYTTFLTSYHGFSSGYVLSYLQSYCWGAAISLIVNVMVLPHSAEQEFRIALVDTLDHIKTLADLIEKTYRFVITDEEKVIRDNLVQSIRGEIDQLESKLMETTLEVNYSRWSLTEYRKMLEFSKSMNRALITAHSSLMQVSPISSGTFQENFLNSSSRDMGCLRKQVFVALTEIQKALTTGPMVASLEKKQNEWLQEELSQIKTYGSSLRSLEMLPGHREEAPLFSPHCRESDFGMDLTQGIRLDLPTGGLSCHSHVGSVAHAHMLTSEPAEGRRNSTNRRVEPKTSVVPPTPIVYDSVSELIRIHWQDFQGIQHQRINEIMLFGTFDQNQKEDVLSRSSRLSFRSSIDSLSETPSIRSCRPADSRISERSDISPGFSSGESSSGSSSDEERTDNSTVGSMEESESGELYRSLIRASSYSFAMKNFLHSLIGIRKLATDWNRLDSTKPIGLHIHLLEALMRESSAGNRSTCVVGQDQVIFREVRTDQQAFALLACRQPSLQDVSLMRRLNAIDRFFRDPNSVYSFKVSCALSVIATLFWADKTRKFALDYGLSASVLTAAVGVTPTLGQTWLSFVSQLIGQGFGLLYGTVMVKLFSDIGGYRYNPYGLVAAMTLLSLPMSYILYTKPQLFVIPFLAMNSAGSLVYIEYINQHRPFDSPALRLGKSLVCLIIAILIVTCIQMFVLRNPAKHTLRSSVAKLIQTNSQYAMILDSFIEAVMASDPSLRPSEETLSQVNAYMIKKEDAIQRDILSLIPLLGFATMEPSLGTPESTGEYLKILRANQAILDRNRETRIAIGNAPFSELVLKEFADVLKPHRQRASQQICSTFHICMASLKAKLPMPTPNTLPLSTHEFSQQIFHEAVQLSVCLAQSPGGIALLQDDELTRYWTYLLSTNGVLVQLDIVQSSWYAGSIS
ncbi:hypothetical protein PCASD_19381 [Puccinia coronata f. sp. avenae]|uniref:Putative ER transporter 6TM N-terminal domain-containing protein n=1 Tax=Puccinia coronata f. sp. avenae TaxID=200324 RepID=A0A2N5SNJ5_9BASI|nr:hypothetical protein PCASD_19381 [Puccinia coronata f. sp. avenae]